jgi:hypothetical protein
VLLSYADRSRVVRPGLARSITARTQESLSTFILDGVVSGLWAVQRERAGATLVLTPFRPLTADERRALSDEGAGSSRSRPPTRPSVTSGSVRSVRREGP